MILWTVFKINEINRFLIHTINLKNSRKSFDLRTEIFIFVKIRLESFNIHQRNNYYYGTTQKNHYRRGNIRRY